MFLIYLSSSIRTAVIIAVHNFLHSFLLFLLISTMQLFKMFLMLLLHTSLSDYYCRGKCVSALTFFRLSLGIKYKTK